MLEKNNLLEIIKDKELTQRLRTKKKQWGELFFDVDPSGKWSLYYIAKKNEDPFWFLEDFIGEYDGGHEKPLFYLRDSQDEIHEIPFEGNEGLWNNIKNKEMYLFYLMVEKTELIYMGYQKVVFVEKKD